MTTTQHLSRMQPAGQIVSERFRTKTAIAAYKDGLRFAARTHKALDYVAQLGAVIAQVQSGEVAWTDRRRRDCRTR